MRRRLRGLVRLIPKIKKGLFSTSFEDELGELTQSELKDVSLGTKRQPPPSSVGR